MLIGGLLTGILLLAAGHLMLPVVLRFMRSHRLVDANYRGEEIPTACGLFLLLMLLLGFLLQRLTGWPTLPADADFVLAATLVCFAGLLDDLVGDKQTKGIVNHWNAWRKSGIPDTAIVKAAATGAAALVLFTSQPKPELLRHTALVLLTTNALNLLDVRPGRALKFYGLMLALLAVAGSVWNDALRPNAGSAWTCLLPVAAGAAVLAYPDVKGRIMLGDTGANLLGFSLGCGLVWYTPAFVQTLFLFLFIGLHGVTWKRSLTRIIESSRWLSFIDGIGRERR